jgi:hypothetical protein
VPPRRQRNLFAVAASSARTTHADVTTAKGQLALGVSGTRRTSIAIVRVTRPAQLGAIIFKHSGQHAHAGVDDRLVQRRACVEHRRQRQLTDVR